MKTMILSAFAFLFGMTANAQETPIKNSELPAEATAFIQKHFSKLDSSCDQRQGQVKNYV